MKRAMVITCPLCGSNDSSRLEALAYDRVWGGLASEWGTQISAGTRERLEPDQPVFLEACRKCELWYFRGAAPGDPEFYEELMMSPRYYHASWKWDFEAALAYVPSGARVLDVGCGPGTFIEGVRRGGGRPTGIDLNPRSIAFARSRGLDARNTSVEEFVATSAGHFDVVTLFQVLEHVENAATFAATAARALRPGGTLVVSVPSRERKSASHHDPLDCPPHHVSRWSSTQLERLGDLLGMERRAIIHETYSRAEFGAHVSIECETVAGSLLPNLAARLAGLSARVGGYLMHGYLRRSGWLLRHRFVVHGMLAAFSRPRTS